SASDRSRSARCAAPGRARTPTWPPSFRRGHCAAIPRTRASNSRSASVEASEEIVDEPLMRIKPDDIPRVGHEIRQRVHVVEVVLAIPIIDEHLDTPDVEIHMPRDVLHRANDLGRRIRLLTRMP